MVPVAVADSLQRAVKRYGWREALRRAPAAVERRIHRRLAKRRQTPASARLRVPTRGTIRRAITGGGMDPAGVFVITDQKFGPQIVRKRTTDWPTYNQIFVREDYKFKHSVPPKTIIDLGANVGYASVWYHAYYPKAHIVAIEPDAGNVSAARVNIALACRNGGRIDIEQTAIWHSRSHVKITNPTGTQWGFRVHTAKRGEPGSFAATTMSAIMDRYGMDTVDLVKIDIEAGERFLFAKNTEWLDRVNSLVIELHDRKIRGCREPVIAALDRHFGDYDEVVRGENTLFTRRHRLDEPRAAKGA
jgi:FkbM family methyltransferase